MIDPSDSRAILDRIATRQFTVGIIGLGYVGLPLAKAAVDAGFPVIGFDNDPTKVATLETGQSYFQSVPNEAIAMMRRKGFVATTKSGRMGQTDALIICLPTPLTQTREPDLSLLRESANEIAPCLKRGHLIVLESTTYPGTTREIVIPALEANGLRAGEDFFLAYSPERQDPGDPTHTVSNVPKVVGGFDTASREVASAFYEQIAPAVVPVSSLEVAEACKMLENTYRAVNIALVNELKMLFDRLGIDIWEVIGAAKTKPFGFQPFYPGPGMGGHCIPVDPFYLAWLARRHGASANFIELAGEVNDSMPEWIVCKIQEALAQRGTQLRGSSVLLVGMAYKRDVDDPRESPGFAIMDLLLQQGAKVNFHDPFIPRLPAMRRWSHLQGESAELTSEILQSHDCVVIVTDHSCFDWEWIVRNSQLVVDTRNATCAVKIGREKVVKA